MATETITQRDRWMARHCAECLVCSRARRKQRGLAFWFVRNIEQDICPFCRAYARVYGRKPHEPIPPDALREGSRPPA